MSEFVYRKYYKPILLIIALSAFLYISYQIITIYLLLAISILIALILKPFVYLLEKQKLSRTLSSLIVFISFLLIIYLSLSFLIPQLVSQMNQLVITLKDVSLNQEISLFEKKVIKVLPIIKEGEISSRVQNFFKDQIYAIIITGYQLLKLKLNIFTYLYKLFHRCPNTQLRSPFSS